MVCLQDKVVEAVRTFFGQEGVIFARVVFDRQPQCCTCNLACFHSIADLL